MCLSYLVLWKRLKAGFCSGSLPWVIWCRLLWSRGQSLDVLESLEITRIVLLHSQGAICLCYFFYNIKNSFHRLQNHPSCIILTNDIIFPVLLLFYCVWVVFWSVQTFSNLSLDHTMFLWLNEGCCRVLSVNIRCGQNFTPITTVICDTTQPPDTSVH